MAPSSRLATSSMAVDHSTVAAAAPPSHVNEPHHDPDHDHDHDHHDHDQVHDVRHTLRKLALSTWQDHQQDVIDSHRWLEGFLESVQLAHTQAAHQGIKPAMSELMKTPGRKRTAANHGSALQQNNQHSLGSAARHSTKDPVATLLFPNAAQPRFLHQGGKENSLRLSPAPRSPLGSPRGSPGGSAAPPSRIAQAKSPLRTASPRPALLKSTQAVRTLSAISAMSPPTSAGKMAIDFAMDIDSPARPSKTSSASSKSKSASKATAEPATPVLSSSKSYAMQDEDDVVFDAIAAAAAMEQDDVPLESEADLDDQEDATAVLDAAANAELSMIGEEEEELEDDHRSIAESYRTAVSQYPGSIISTATSSQASAPRLSTGRSQGSQRVVSSSASSIAEEADADTAVPLNDAPSSLRNATATPLASSTSSSHPPPSTGTTQTPGGGAASTFSYSVGSYSAAKVGSLGLGNSPQASNASRKSIGNNGPPKPLKFVSIPKKSLGLGLVRNWATSSATTDSQQSLNSQASSIGQVLSSAATTTTATGATKRKSMNDDSTAPPSKRMDAESATSPPAASGVNSLMNRMREMQSRQSTVSGVSSRLSGISGSSSFVHKPLSNNLSLSVAAMSTTTTNGTAPSAPATSVAQTQAPASVPAISAPAPRPSVMDRVKSFERTASPTSTSTASRLPLSPSRLGRAMSPVTRSATAMANTISPPQSPRMGMASSTFGQSMSKIASPPTTVPTALVRSPRIAAAAAKIVSPSPSSPVKTTTTTTTTTTRSSPAVQPKSPARVADMAMHKMRISTTPKESPPNKPATTTTTTTKMTNMSALMKDMDDVASSRLNSPVVKTSKSGLGKSTQTRYEDEEDEEMVRDDEDDDELLGQLPPRLEHDDADDESDGEGYGRGRTVVSQGQGKLAVAMDAEGGALKKSQSKTVMPGTFGAEDEEEEEGDRSMEYSEPTKFKVGPITCEVLSSSPLLTRCTSSQPTHYAGTSSIRQPTLQKKSSHSSLASSQSSQAPSRPGSAMYGSVKGTNNASVSSHIKSVQAAERARQKQQEEADRKNAQKLEVQNKRAEMAQKKKAEEDRVRRDELERRRKEREERERKLKQQRPETKKTTTTTTQSQPSQYPGSSAPLRPYPSTTSSNLNSSQPRPPNGGLSASQPSNHRQMPGASSSTSATASSSMIGVKYMVPNPSNLGASSSAPPRAIAPPQFATKAFAPPQPPRIVAPPPQAEPYQELPEIDSEYSDSGDEEARAVKIAAMPGWAQSPALAAALYAQQQINPRDIFGPIPPLQMHEIFRNANLTRLTRRTSSACWEGTDALTADDLRRYEARMGYTRQSVSAQAARQ
ncbi:BZ3500_MvSof-1268-A1-R1_Chr3-1g06121 [Microbotryum saponariae]|uniref:BZ3500_MvSof-1268-A1-R1_Chr3-1g06121 protein n=1 Tax=Microbotryum saponariae TaxID=289078 RepID=A0A2X0LAS8_9BASI|nr:BZ3500_MvSof-1268-A1-R1_Chr3-1g06121 [Microbotryum saponariae]SDA03984.1 BZ3501_MvSof-1269-A2-R1_Chr3-2g05806 [Microbotryum saponariae]